MFLRDNIYLKISLSKFCKISTGVKNTFLFERIIVNFINDFLSCCVACIT